jgi:outer membrane protein OmpA-like peptidoglycan-associated protein
MSGPLLVCLAALGLPGAAWADDPLIDRSIDTQLVQPVFDVVGGVAVDSPRTSEPMQLSAGAAWQLEREPLRYQLSEGPGGAAIAQRSTLHLGLSLAVGERTTLYLRGSGVRMEAGDLPLVAPARSLAMGDLLLGVKGRWFERGALTLGPAVGLWIPVGSDESWVAERSLRYAPAVLGSLRGERLELLANLGLLARVEVDSGADFVASPELSTGAALVAHATPWAAGLVEITSRRGVGHLLEAGAENPAEIRAGLRAMSTRWGRVDLMVGTGLGEGYGTSPLRALVSVTGWTHPRPVERDPRPLVAPPPMAAPIVTVQPEPEPEPEPATLAARVDHGRIVPDSPIEFEPGSAVLTAGSEQALEQVALVIHDYPQIELLVVQGHADEHAQQLADYELSLRRARVVFERLVAQAVRPERISYRGMGGADPGSPGAPRSVDLLIARVRPLQHGAASLQTSDILLPWSGEAVSAVLPGDKLLGMDGHPILELSPLPEGAPLEAIPSGESFREALEEQDRADPEAEEAP